MKLRMQKNKYKLIEKKMNKLKFFSVAFFASFTLVNAQDIDQAKKAIDAEQFEKAKTILKSLLQAKPSNGTASFLLGNVYMSQKELDSAKIYYQKGIEELESLQLLDLSPLANWKLSSFKQGFGLSQLREDSPDSYWQSDGSNGSNANSVRLRLNSKST